ncbi:MAG: ACT domain-containing protein [Candidatus Dormiibacterota bacterium]
MLTIRVGGQELGIRRLPADAELPAWATSVGWLSVTRTPDELSVVYPLAEGPATQGPSGPWRALTVEGPLDHDLVGVLASLSVPLAEAAVPIFVISTYDTDHVLVPASRLDAALEALTAAGHRVVS